MYSYRRGGCPHPPGTPVNIFAEPCVPARPKPERTTPITDGPKPILPSLGIDMVEVERISKHLEDDHFLNRIFTENERHECEGRAKPEECFAARWAAKEATAKALGTGIGKYLNFKDVEVVTIPGKGPRIRIHGHFSQFPMLTKLSLTHTRTTGAAIVMVFPDDDEHSESDFPQLNLP